jgi:two-component system, OmpR family, sensor kinase
MGDVDRVDGNMMHREPSFCGLILYCDDEGGIEEIVHNGVNAEFVSGRKMTEFVAPGNLDKFLNLLVSIKTKGYIIGCEIMLCVADECVVYQLAGVREPEEPKGPGRILLVAYSTFSDLFEQLMRINNEQANLLRAKAKEYFTVDSQSQQLYEEMTRINNELVNARRKLAKRNASLTRLNEEKNRIMGILAHDLRNPIGAIDGFINVLMAEECILENASLTQILGYINTSNRFMLELLTEVLDLSRIESGRIDLEPQPTDLNELVERNLEINRVLANKKGMEILFERVPDLPAIRIDPLRVNQVLNNLISNAVKFSYPENSIRVRLTPDTENSSVSISVKDSGQGIRPEDQEKLFTPFYKTSTLATHGESSTGLGLAIVKKIVDLHGGSVSVESRHGEGSTFTISLPA